MPSVERSKCSSADDLCPMFETYARCEECPKYVNGYPEGKCLKHCVNGVGYVAYSTVPDNQAPVDDYIGNDDPSEPWVVVKHCEFLEWLIAKATSGFLTEAQANVLIAAATSGFLTEAQANVLIAAATAGFLTEAEIQALITAATAGFLTEAEIQALIDAAKPTCDDFPTKDTTADAEILFCGGGTFGKSTFSEFLDKACFSFPDLPADACNLKPLVEGTDSSGCTKAFRYNASELCVGAMTPWGINQAPYATVVMPADGGAAGVDYYTEDTLTADANIDPLVGGSSVDAALLNKTLFAASNAPVVLTCTTRLDFSIQLNQVVFDLLEDGQKEADIVITVDDGSGEQVSATSVTTWPITKFTNAGNEYQTVADKNFLPGSYTFKAYLVAANGSTADVTNIVVAGNDESSGSLIIDICKKV